MIGAPATPAAKMFVCVARKTVSKPPHECPMIPIRAASTLPIVMTFLTAAPTQSATDSPGSRGRNDDVGLQEHVAEAGEDRRVVRFAIGRAAPAVEPVRQPLVHVDDHRILPARLVAGRVEQGALQPLAALVLVLDELGRAPCVVAGERVRLRDRSGAFQFRPADHDVRRIVERLDGVGVDLGILGLCEARDALVVEHEWLQSGTGIEPRVAGLLGPDAEEAEMDRLAGVDPLFVGIEPRISMPDLLGRAIGQPRGARSVRGHPPRVELVVEDHGLVVLRPPGERRTTASA